MRFHILGLPHTSTTKEYCPCAYTQKLLNFSNMMRSLGHDTYLYAGPDNTANCTEHVPVISHSEQKQHFGHADFHHEFFAIEYQHSLPYWQLVNSRGIAAIRERKQPRDFIMSVAGHCQSPIASAFPDLMTVEGFVGYEGTFASFRVFESYAWMHHVYGLQRQRDGRSYDTVIPNYFDPADFDVVEDKEDYILFIGRMVRRKGIETAVEATRRAGIRLVMAGQGVQERGPGFVRAAECTAAGVHIEHVGVVDVQQRKRLMGRARAVIVPTSYIGPFEGVHVEALLCGTPVITTDWGAFTETVVDGMDGYRCRTLGEFVAAIDRVRTLSPASIRERAVARFSTDVVRYRYEDYFRQLLTLWGEGWYDTEYDGSVKRALGSFS